LKHLRGQDGNLHQYRPVISRASMEANFRWTTTPAGEGCMNFCGAQPPVG